MEARVHLRGLNGLRAIAALSVVVIHTNTKGFGGFVITPNALCIYAVTIFFTLSGFLITYLLSLEKEKQTINIRNFYCRRGLRIWPLYFAYLLVALIVTWLIRPEQLPGELLYYLFFAANVPVIIHSSITLLEHYWSLGVEEQFYIFWPWLIKRSNNIFKGIIIFTALFLSCKLVVRLFFYSEANPLFLNSFFVTRFDCMSIGAIGALLCLKKNKLFLFVTTHKISELVCWLCLIAIPARFVFISNFFNDDIAAVITVCLIVNLSFNSKAIIQLENRFFDFLGKISYGIYVIHPLVILLFYSILKPFKMAPVIKDIGLLVCVLLFTTLIAWLSYEFFEKRFLLLKDRFTIIKSGS